MVAEVQSPTKPTLTEQIADYAVSLRYEDIPQPVVDRAKELLGFEIGNALRGTATPSGRRGVQAALDVSGSADDCTIVGERARAGVLEAAFANSCLVAGAGGASGLFPSGVMAGIVGHPPAWAVGELTKASGRELLTAVVIGYDVMAKLHSGELPYESAIPRPTKMAVEPFGVAVMAARLLGLSHAQTVDAFGHAGQSVMSLYEGKGLQWMIHPLTARNGVFAAMLARAGLSGASTIVEGEHGIYPTFFLQDVPDHVRANLATLGSDFEIAKAWTTRYPVSAGNAIPIDLTQQLADENAVTPDRIASVDVVLPESRRAREAIYGVYPKGPTTVVAIALTDRRFDPARFEEPLSDEVLAARDKVQLRFEDGHGFFYARVEMSTTDGQRYMADAGGDMPPEQPPLDCAEWLADSNPDVVDADKLSRLVDLLSRLEDVSDVGEVVACLVPTDDQR